MKTSGKIIGFCTLFLLILGTLILNSGWYGPARLVIHGTAHTTDTVIDVQWDSGAGYNRYEQRRFQFLPVRGGKQHTQQIIIGKVNRSDEQDRRNRVLLTEVRIDEKGVPIPASVLENIRHKRHSGWFFDSSESQIELQLPVSKRIQVIFSTSQRGGLAHLSIGGTEVLHDLYRSNWEVLKSEVNFWLLDDQGNFTLSFDLPRYAIDLLQVSGVRDTQFSTVSLDSKAGRVELPFTEVQDGQIQLKSPNENVKAFFHPFHLSLQIGFSLLLSWLLWSAGKVCSRYGTIRNLMFGDSRWLFWTFFLGAIATYGLWLLAFWPGVMSVDSLNIWRAALFPEMMINNHPLLNEIWYLLLLFLWNNIAIVPIVQIILLAALIATAFFFIFEAGVKLRWLIPCYVFLLLSVPVGLYNVTLWKDVPFALLVVFWALLAAYLYFRKMQGRNVQFGAGRAVFLLIAFIALLLFRHNGLIYLFILPPIFFGIGLVKIPKALILIGGIAAIGLIYLVVFPPNGIKGGSYFHDLSSKYLEQIETETPARRLANAAAAYPRILDIKKNQQTSDFWHYYLGDRYAYSFLRDVGWFDAFHYIPPDEHLFPKLRERGGQIYEQSLDYPWLYFSWYPFWMGYLFLLSVVLFRWLPLSAIFSIIILVQVFALLFFVGTVNWRYYYFLLLGGYFLLPICLLDLHNLRMRKASE